MVKSQIHAGGRGKGTFTDGFKGGVKFCKTKAEARDLAGKMLGNTLVTAQTGPAGRKVQTIYFTVASDIKKEYYLAILLDRGHVPAGDRRLDRGRRRDREGRPRDSREDLQGLRRPGLRPGRLPGPGPGLPARLHRRGGEERRPPDPGALQAVLGDRRRDGRDQSPDHDAGRRGPGPRRQGLVRRQRAFPPSRDPRAARPERGGSQGDRGLQARAQLHRARRQHRLPGQRRRPRDEHDGHHQAFRRQSRPTSSTSAAAPPRSRSSRRSRSSWATRT